MRKQFSVLAVLITIFLSSCIKDKNECGYTDSAVVAPASEVTALQGWISANASTAIQHPSGFFYIINNPGTGASASVCSSVTVKYNGWLLNGAPFDSNTTGFTSILGQLILGWQKGMPLIKAGGSITLFIPPSLGYGSQDIKNSFGAVVIPANSNLHFKVDLVAVQ
jgi:FKBP-type peptidyl-prolyl cis-trans isomerase FkpA